MASNDVMPSQDQVDHRAMCKYGENCYQTNPMHLEKFRHPKRKSKEPQIEPEAKKIKLEEEKENDLSAENTKEKENASSPEHVKEGKEILVAQDSNEKKEVQESSEDLPKEDRKEEEKEEEEEEDHLDLLPESPEDVKMSIKQKFLVDMPDDFYHFWNFCKERNLDKPEEALLAACNLKLVGPYDVLSGKIQKVINRKASNFLRHWRFYYDTPEFQTVIVSTKSNFHFGYFRDDPKDMPVFVASNDGNSGNLKVMGENVFSAVYNYIATLIQEADPFRQSALQKLKESIHVYATMKVQDMDIRLDMKTPQLKARDKLKVTKTFHGAGLVVPYNRETQIGYREIPESNASLKRIFQNLIEAKTDQDKDKAFDVLQELITNVQFANDEGDPGMGLELGINAFCFGGERLHSTVAHLLGVGYELVQRNEFSKIIQAHLKHRKEGQVFKIQ